MTAATRHLAALAIVLLLPSLARAETTPSEMKALKFLEGGYSLLNAGDLDGARAAFLKARDLVPEKPNPYRFLGLVEVRLGHCAEAVAALDQFLKRVPQHDPRTAEAIALRDKCKEELIPRVGTLVVTSRPAGAQVRLDDDAAPALGLTPWKSADVSVGAHVVFLRLPGFTTLSRPVQIARGATVKLDLPLTPATVATPTNKPKPTPRLIAIATPPPPTTKRKSKAWVAGVVIAFVAAGAVGVGLGVGLTQPTEPTFPNVMAQ